MNRMINGNNTGNVNSDEVPWSSLLIPFSHTEMVRHLESIVTYMLTQVFYQSVNKISAFNIAVFFLHVSTNCTVTNLNVSYVKWNYARGHISTQKFDLLFIQKCYNLRVMVKLITWQVPFLEGTVVRSESEFHVKYCFESLNCMVIDMK